MMHRLDFSIDIKAEKSAIWKALWEDESYRDWASVFFEGSFIVADNWEVGNIVHFLGPDKSGIYSRIEEHIPNKLIEFSHIGKVVKGKEQAIDVETKTWSGASETYSIQEINGVVTLSVQIDVMDEHLDFMKKTLPLALDKVKVNCSE